MNRPVSSWNCAKCGATAYAEQNFCRACGTARVPAASAPVTQPVPVIGGDGEAVLSRRSLAAIALLFVVIGGVSALIVDDFRGEPTSPIERPTQSTTPHRGSGRATSSSRG